KLYQPKSRPRPHPNQRTNTAYSPSGGEGEERAEPENLLAMQTSTSQHASLFLSPGASGWCSTRTSLTQKCQDIVDGIQKMDALERAAHHEFETAVRGASGAERQQSLCTLRGVRRLAADGAQVVAALSGAWSAWPGRAKPAARF